MCKWYCTSNGPSTDLRCLSCGCRYCGACLHGEAGKMQSLIKCAKCGKKPTVQPKEKRSDWQTVTHDNHAKADQMAPARGGGHVPASPELFSANETGAANLVDGHTMNLRSMNANVAAARPVHPAPPGTAPARAVPSSAADGKVSGETVDNASVAPTAGAAVDGAFFAFCGAGKSDMDGKTFAKLCKDSRIVDKKFTSTDADLIFQKAVEKGQRRIKLPDFERALELIAQRKNVPVAAVQAAILSAGGPQFGGTAAEAVRFHDDQSTYTGVHAKGGPVAVPKGTGTAA